MFGNGAKTIGIVAIPEYQRMDRRGFSRIIIVFSLPSVCAAVLGSSTLITVVLPTALGTSPATTISTAVFGLPVSPQDFRVSFRSQIIAPHHHRIVIPNRSTKL